MKGIVIKTKLGFAKAIALFPFIFTETVAEKTLNHERIHLRQQLELLVIPFYLWYGIEYVVRLFGKSGYVAYKNIGFERECFSNDKDMNYLKKRKPYSFLKYL
jgi:hypothetical protein